MSLRKSEKISCTICGQLVGIFTCRDCGRNFCLQHTNEHRTNVDRQMKQIIHEHQQLHIDRTKLLKEINQWEEHMIDNIHRLAEEKRKYLKVNYEHFQQLTFELQQVKEQGQFVETNLNIWKKKLDDIRKYLQQKQINQSIDECEQSFYEDYSNNDTDKDEYAFGKHLLRFKIDQYQTDTSIYLGIRSKNLSEQVSFYGWTGEDLVYVAGKSHRNYLNYRSDIQTNDVLILLIDCHERKISLTNERTRKTYQLNIDLVKCPFPWLANVRFFKRSK